jgi:hypothetical protein
MRLPPLSETGVIVTGRTVESATTCAHICRPAASKGHTTLRHRIPPNGTAHLPLQRTDFGEMVLWIVKPRKLVSFPILPRRRCVTGSASRRRIREHQGPGVAPHPVQRKFGGSLPRWRAARTTTFVPTGNSRIIIEHGHSRHARQAEQPGRRWMAPMSTASPDLPLPKWFSAADRGRPDGWAWSHTSGAPSAVRCTPRALRSGCAPGRRCPRR